MYCVRCRNAAGTAHELNIEARNSNEAIRIALAHWEARFPGQAWVAEFTL